MQWSPYSSKDRAARLDLNSQEFKDDISKAIEDGCNFKKNNFYITVRMA